MSKLAKNPPIQAIINQAVVIDNPIGNLYRKNHVLILVKTYDNKYLLGQKAGFYPDGIARFVGGGVNHGEDPLAAAVRELSEELHITKNPNDLIHLVRVETSAQTSVGKMQMTTNIYFCELNQGEKYSANDDLNGLVAISQPEFESLIERMQKLDTEFITEKYSFKWSDWAKIYAPIHKIALEIYTTKYA